MLYNGRTGISGKYEYLVKDVETQEFKIYEEKYKIRIESFNFRLMDDDNVIEPGEFGYISDVTIVNEGKMPTPKYHEFVVQCIENEYVLPLSSSSIEKNISPGTHINQLKSEFKIKDA